MRNKADRRAEERRLRVSHRRPTRLGDFVPQPRRARSIRTAAMRATWRVTRCVFAGAARFAGPRTAEVGATLQRRRSHRYGGRPTVPMCLARAMDHLDGFFELEAPRGGHRRRWPHRVSWRVCCAWGRGHDFPARAPARQLGLLRETPWSRCVRTASSWSPPADPGPGRIITVTLPCCAAAARLGGSTR